MIGSKRVLRAAPRITCSLGPICSRRDREGRRSSCRSWCCPWSGVQRCAGDSLRRREVALPSQNATSLTQTNRPGAVPKAERALHAAASTRERSSWFGLPLGSGACLHPESRKWRSVRRSDEVIGRAAPTTSAILVRVKSSTTPSASNPVAIWKAIVASRVACPNQPSTSR
jgi:hypothetical protein